MDISGELRVSQSMIESSETSKSCTEYTGLECSREVRLEIESEVHNYAEGISKLCLWI